MGNAWYAVTGMARKRHSGGTRIEAEPMLVSAASYQEALGIALETIGKRYSPNNGWGHTVVGVNIPLKRLDAK